MLASQYLAVGFQAHGLSGVMLVIALICFLIAAVVGYFVTPLHRVTIALIAAGGFFAVLAQLITG